MVTDRIPLTLLPLELRRLTGGNVPAYRVGYNAALDGRIPAERGDNGRWTVARADLPKIAAALGCTAPASIAA
jgi:hypothetical protein